jgi:hypothetical protein
MIIKYLIKINYIYTIKTKNKPYNIVDSNYYLPAHILYKCLGKIKLIFICIRDLVQTNKCLPMLLI